MITSYVALGSNYDNPLNHIRQALVDINNLHGAKVLKCSSLYQNPPYGPVEQPDFINAVIEVQTILEPLPLLNLFKSIEKAHNRVPTVKWGPRSLDIDILLMGNISYQSERLTLPHKELELRNFVLYPLYDIAPDLILPSGRDLKSVLESVSNEHLAPLDLPDPLSSLLPATVATRVTEVIAS